MAVERSGKRHNNTRNCLVRKAQNKRVRKREREKDEEENHEIFVYMYDDSLGVAASISIRRREPQKRTLNQIVVTETNSNKPTRSPSNHFSATSVLRTANISTFIIFSLSLSLLSSLSPIDVHTRTFSVLSIERISEFFVISQL